MHTRARAVILSLPFVALVAAGVAAPSVAMASNLNVRVHVDGFTFGYRQGHYLPRHGYYHRHYRTHYFRHRHDYPRGYYQRHPRYWHYKPGRYYGKRRPYYRSQASRHDRGRPNVMRRHHRAQRGFRDAVVGRQHGGKRR